MEDIKKILNQREQTHGSFFVQAHISQTLKKVLYEYDIKLSARQKESLGMILHKIARILAGNPNTQDHWDDIAGYAMLVSNSLKEENK